MSNEQTDEQRAVGDEAAQHDEGEEQLEGWIPEMATTDEVRDALEKAFDYRGDITITLKDGEKVEGYVFDRQINGRALEDCVVRLFPQDRDEKVSIGFDRIARLEFSGRDTAAGKSFETWMKKYKKRMIEEARAAAKQEREQQASG